MYILDCVEEFWSKMHETIGQCETVEEWEAMMKTMNTCCWVSRYGPSKIVVMMVCGTIIGLTMSQDWY